MEGERWFAARAESSCAGTQYPPISGLAELDRIVLRRSFASLLPSLRQVFPSRVLRRLRTWERREMQETATLVVSLHDKLVEM